MTYATERVKAGRQSMMFAICSMDFCANTYGSSPCTATGGSGEECWNTIPGCQDEANYSETGKDYTFCDLQGAPVGVDAFPCIVDYQPIPAKADPGKTLGERPGVKLTMKDFPHHDRGIDPYVDNRSYTPEARGTFWGKWLARNKYYSGRQVEIRTGYIASSGFDWADFQSRYYIIDSAKIDANGQVTFTLRDVLKLADDKRALCPAASTGKVSLAINDSFTTSIQLDDVTEYPSSGTIRVGSELITYTGKTGTTNGTLDTLTRGAFGSTAASHSVDDPAQECAVFNSANVIDIIKTLLEDYAGIASSFIPHATDWTTEKNEYLTAYNLTAVISKPTGVTKLINELVEQCRLLIWFDDINQKIQLQTLVSRRDTTDTTVEEESTLIRDSIKIEEQEHERVSRVIVFYGMIDQAGRLDEISNFSRSYVSVDTSAEASTRYNDKRAKIIYSRWFSTSNDSAVTTTASRLQNQLVDGLKKAYFKLDIKDDVEVGDVFSIEYKTVQGLDGSKKSTSYQATSVKESVTGHELTIEAINTGAQLRGFYIAPAGLGDYNSATGEQRSKYGFICRDTHKFDDGEDAYGII